MADAKIKMKPQPTARQLFEDFSVYAAEVRPGIERSLQQYLPLSPAHINEQFNAALRYALFPGGKRLRPMLTLLGGEIIGHTDQNILAASTAVEYIHTSSIILDDLPCMDNAGKRRARASLHIQYGEGLAILVAIALLNASYGLVLHSCHTNKDKALRAHKEMVECVGAHGMVVGQAIDIADKQGLKSNIREEEFESARNLKTSALIRFAIKLGAILCDASHAQLATLSNFAELLGSAYQVSDDLLDVEEDHATANGSHNISSNTEAEKEIARERVASLLQTAKDSLIIEFGLTRPTLLLCQITDFIAVRNC